MFRNAIVRVPASNFERGLTRSALGKPILAKALTQHSAYCKALESCGLRITMLDADPLHPDSVFVEDTAVLVGNVGILTRPGARSREGEVLAMRGILEPFFPTLYEIRPPGTVDGGDVCKADDHFLIGISRRTNEEGAHQLARVLSGEGFASSFVDIRGINSALHLKSGIAYIGEKKLVVTQDMAELDHFIGFDLIRVAAEESYAANCLRVNDWVLFPLGFSGLESSLRERGFRPYPVDASEFRKMDGGLSCLSLRF